MLLLPAVAFLCLAFPQEEKAEPLWIATTRDGLQIESVEQAISGDLQVETPFGRLNTPTDPVREGKDRSGELQRLRQLRTEQPELAVRWAQAARDGGFLTELVHGVDAYLGSEEEIHPEIFHALEYWGIQIDSVPSRLKVSQRIDWLWSEILREKTSRVLLLGERLVSEVHASEQADGERQLSFADLRKGLRHKNPLVRRVAARVAGKQQFFDQELAASIFTMSLFGKSVAERDGAAWAATQIHPHDARQYWFMALARAEESLRKSAAMHLARYGGEDAIDGFMVVLSAFDKKSTRTYPFHGKKIQAVRDTKKPTLRVGVGLSAYNYDVLKDSSTFKVTRHSEEFTLLLLEALDIWAGKLTERRPIDWLDWYLKNYSPSFK